MSIVRKQLNDLLAQYGQKKTVARRPAPVEPKVQPKKRLPLPPEPVRRDPSTSERKTILPRELIWNTLERFGIRHKVLVSEIPNYAAERASNGTWSVVRLEPHTVIARRLRLKDVMPTIRKHHEQAIAIQVYTAEKQRQTEAEAQSRIDTFENNPGFYIVPGETIGPDDKTYNASGPYYRFESAGKDFENSPENLFETDQDVEDDALATMRRPEGYRTRVKIIEAQNARDAAKGNGHVWWEQGTFRGPPADPRQRGFGF